MKVEQVQKNWTRIKFGDIAFVSNENEFDPLEIFKEYKDTKEESSKWQLAQVFQKTDIIGNLIKKKRNNFYFLDLDF